MKIATDEHLLTNNNKMTFQSFCSLLFSSEFQLLARQIATKKGGALEEAAASLRESNPVPPPPPPPPSPPPPSPPYYLSESPTPPPLPHPLPSNIICQNLRQMWEPSTEQLANYFFATWFQFKASLGPFSVAECTAKKTY